MKSKSKIVTLQCWSYWHKSVRSRLISKLFVTVRFGQNSIISIDQYVVNCNCFTAVAILNTISGSSGM
jgi:hypothetical protein